MLSGYRIYNGHIKTSQGGHALTNKLLIKFLSKIIKLDLVSKKILKKSQGGRNIKKTLLANI